MRLLLLVAVVLLGVDAVAYSGAYSQAAWRTVTNQVQTLEQRVRTGSVTGQPADAGQPATTR